MRNKLLRNTEWSIIIVSLILFAIGMIALFSATQSTEYGEFRKQIQWFLISVPFIIIVSVVDYNIIVKFSPLLYLILIGLLIGVLFTEPINGASSWYKIGDFLSFQPSELRKSICNIIYGNVVK